MLTCPNIRGNPFYGQHFAELKERFNHPSFRIYGLQPEHVDDPQVAGTIPFAEVLAPYRKAADLLYTYRWPAVCLLPPIKMMIVAGPVVYLAGFLLDRCMPPDAPGRARDMIEAERNVSGSWRETPAPPAPSSPLRRRSRIATSLKRCGRSSTTACGRC